MIKGDGLVGVESGVCFGEVVDIRTCFLLASVLAFLCICFTLCYLSCQTMAMSHDRFDPKTEFVFRELRICVSFLEVGNHYNSEKLKCRMYHVQIH